MRRPALLLVALPVLVACESKPSYHFRAAVDATSGGEASCVSPYLNNQPPDGPYIFPTPKLTPGQKITVYGHWYTPTCNDTGTHDPVTPLPPVQLTLRLPGGKTRRLGRFTPGGPDMGFSVLVRIPAASRQGTATIRDDRSPYPAIYRFSIAA